jgi:predicted CXXCH cytochrome family protein
MAKKGLLSFEYVAEARPLEGAWLQLILFFLAVAVLTAFLLLMASVPAQAVGPHGPFDSTTEKCEQCHAMHTGATKTLLGKKDVMELCRSCHSGGIGADTAVMQGVLMTPVTPGGTDRVVTGTLLGGGFDAVGGTTITTSEHDLGAVAAPYGGADMGATITLTCTSCHTPHDNPNYRLLRRRPGNSGADVYVSWNGPADLGGGALDYKYDEEDLDPVTPGVQFFTNNYKAGMSAWCSGCHTQYMIREDSAPYDAGDSVGAEVRYRHAVDMPIIATSPNIFNGKIYDLETDLPLQDVNNNGRDTADTMTCLTCHKAHGSTAVMTEETVLSASGDRGSLPAGTDSLLLRLNNREICQIACHKVVN